MGGGSSLSGLQPEQLRNPITDPRHREEAKLLRIKKIKAGPEPKFWCSA